MTKITEPLRIEDMPELLRYLQLRVVKEDSFSARRVEPEDREEHVQSVRFEVVVSEENLLLTQFSFSFINEDCSIQSGFTAAWSTSCALTISGQAMGEFLERVAIMAVYPYQREALSAYATRLRVPVPTLGLMRQGEIDLQIATDSLDQFLQDKVLFPVVEEV